MGIFTSKHKKNLGLSQRGQSIVEYVMLMAVVGTFITTLMNSNLIKDLLGPNSGFFSSMRLYNERTYQYGHYSTTNNFSYSLGGEHDTYTQDSSTSRFWTPKNIDE